MLIKRLYSSRGNRVAHGILGMDFLLRHHCLLDCSDLRLYVRPDKLEGTRKQALAASLTKSGYCVARLHPTRGLVLVCDARINDRGLVLLLDTGAFVTIIDPAAAKWSGLRFARRPQGFR